MTEGEAGFTEQDVADYLRKHPEFFDRRPEALLALALEHSPGAGTASLVQRQVARLRRNNAELETRIARLSALARNNRALAEKIHRLSVALLPPGSAAKRIERLLPSLQRHFSVDRVGLILFPSVTGVHPVTGLVKVVDRSDLRLKAFAGWLDPERPRCGRLLVQHRAFLFGEHKAVLESAATVPLGERARFGFLVIASHDPERFNRGKHMDFLRLLGDVVTAALAGGAAPRRCGQAGRRAGDRMPTPQAGLSQAAPDS